MSLQKVKRLSTEKLGEDLLHAVAAFELHERVSKQSRGFWALFATWANNDAQFASIGGDDERWSDRYHVAAFRFSSEGKRQAEIGKRALAIAKRKGIKRQQVVEAMGTGSGAGHRLAGLLPWHHNTLVRLALLLNVAPSELEGDPAFTRDELPATKPVVPRPTPPPAEPRQLSMVPVPTPSTAQSMHNRMFGVIEKLRSMARAKRDATHETLSALVAYVDGVDALDIIIPSGKVE